MKCNECRRSGVSILLVKCLRTDKSNFLMVRVLVRYHEYCVKLSGLGTTGL